MIYAVIWVLGALSVLALVNAGYANQKADMSMRMLENVYVRLHALESDVGALIEATDDESDWSTAYDQD